MREIGKLSWDEDVESFAQKPELKQHLAYVAAKSLASRGSKLVITDCTEKVKQQLNAKTLLAVALALSVEIKKQVSNSRIGIALPTGRGAILANLAILLAGKVPVNLNFTLGTEAIQQCLDRARLDAVITAGPVMERASHFPWPKNVIDIKELIPTIPKSRIVRNIICIQCLPFRVLAKLHKIPTLGGDQEAGLIFTSGSSGEPKAVVLTHSNIIGNIEQIAHHGVLVPDDVIMGTLPLFHSFGFTIGMFYPLVKSATVVTLPSPLETNRIIKAIREEKATIHLGTPTFFRPLFKKAKAEDLKSLRAVVAGAEKTPEGMHERWEEMFGSAFLEGYGLTETSPVVSCNLPVSDHRRKGSVGKLFPGMEAKVLNPDTGDAQDVGLPGILAMRGVNIFPGYLDNPEANKEAFDKDGWFVTGDIARFDEDGFIYIEGRLSRFSKIGGEMVPHINIENAIMRALGLEGSEVPILAVSGRKDAAKGEALVIVSAVDIDMDQLRDKLKEAGESLPNLWIPRECVRVEAIPILGSGKLDLKALQTAAAGA